MCSARACAGEAAPAGKGAEPEGKPSSGSSSSSASGPNNHRGGRQLSLGPFALHHDASPLCIFGKVYCLLYMGSQAYTQRLASETRVVTITSVHLVVPSIYLLNRHTPFIEPLSQSNDDRRQKDLGAMLHGIHHNLNDPFRWNLWTMQWGKSNASGWVDTCIPRPVTLTGNIPGLIAKVLGCGLKCKRRIR